MSARTARRAGRGVWAVSTALLAVAVSVSGCTTVPDSSGVQIVRPVQPTGTAAESVAPPAPGMQPREIVNYFVQANAHANSGARNAVIPSLVLSPSAPIYVLDNVQTSNPQLVDPSHPTSSAVKVTASGNELAEVRSGVYQPAGGTPVNQVFTLAKVPVRSDGASGSTDREWRITQVSSKSTLIDAHDFYSNFRQRPVYFLNSPGGAGSDTSETLVPDPRYTAASDKSLITFLIAQLAAGPTASGLQSAFPDGDTPSNVQVVPPKPNSPSDAPIRIEIPSANQIPTTGSGNGQDDRDRLAAQIAATLQSVGTVENLEITDGGVPVRIPMVGGSIFSASDVLPAFQVHAPPHDLFYVRAGSVFDRSGVRLPIDTDNYTVGSVALAPTPAPKVYNVAAVVGGKSKLMYIGNSPELRRVVDVKGSLSRPSWEPGGGYAWIGAGSDLWRVSPTGVAVKVNYQVAGLTISAVRVSPEGARIAMVLTSNGAGNGAPPVSQVYMGFIVGGPHPVVADLAPVTPKNAFVTDVSWYDDLELFAVGHTVGSTQPGVYDFHSDGSRWTPLSIANLPGVPDSVTVASGQFALVSVGDFMYEQTNSGWQQFPTSLDILGSDPVYVE